MSLLQRSSDPLLPESAMYPVVPLRLQVRQADLRRILAIHRLADEGGANERVLGGGFSGNLRRDHPHRPVRAPGRASGGGAPPHALRRAEHEQSAAVSNDDGRGFARSRRRVIAGSFSCVQLGFFAFGTSDASCLYAVSLLNKHPT